MAHFSGLCQLWLLSQWIAACKSFEDLQDYQDKMNDSLNSLIGKLQHPGQPILPSGLDPNRPPGLGPRMTPPRGPPGPPPHMGPG